MEKVLHRKLEKILDDDSNQLDTKRIRGNIQEIIKELEEEAHPTEPALPKLGESNDSKLRNGTRGSKKWAIRSGSLNKPENSENNGDQEPRGNARRLSFHEEEGDLRQMEIKRNYSDEDEPVEKPEVLSKQIKEKSKGKSRRGAGVQWEAVEEQKEKIVRKTTSGLRKTYMVLRRNTIKMKPEAITGRAGKVDEETKKFFLRKIAPLKEVLEKERAKEAEKEASLRKRPQTMRPNEHINNTFSPYRPIKLNDILEDETKHEMMLIQKKREQIIKSYHIKAKISLLTSLLY